MNPSYFLKSLKNAESGGVLVGFEFEICIPKKSIPVPKEINPYTINLVVSIVPFYEWGELLRYKPTNQTLQEIYVDALPQYVKSKVVPVFEVMDGDEQQEVLNLLENPESELPSWMGFTQEFKESYYFIIAMKKIVGPKSLLSTSNIISLTLGQGWTSIVNDLDVTVEEFNSLAAENNLISGVGSTNYGGKYIIDDIKREFGDTVFFQKYHESPKDMITWYIEPDSSITPNPNDFQAEVVSPPLPATRGMAALDSFYTLADNKGWYTNSSTGLHINVSIPKNYDLLKLALILGDKHVLKSFNRENSTMAKSIYDNLVSGNMNQYRDTYPDMTHLKYLAEKIASDRCSSVSLGGDGKYLSFRHAGGDYLQNSEAIKTTVGRFIRALVISADPSAYRNEYLKTLGKLVHAAGGSGDTLQRIRNLKSSPINMRVFVTIPLVGKSLPPVKSIKYTTWIPPIEPIVFKSNELVEIAKKTMEKSWTIPRVLFDLLAEKKVDFNNAVCYGWPADKLDKGDTSIHYIDAQEIAYVTLLYTADVGTTIHDAAAKQAIKMEKNKRRA